MIGQSQVKVRLSPHGISSLLDAPRDAADRTITLTVKAALKRCGLETKFVIDGPRGDRDPKPDPALIKAIVKAHDWFDRLISGKGCSLADIADEEEVSRTYIYPRIRLAFLAPDVIESILNGRHPSHLNAEGLIRSGQIPIRWQDQSERLGFASSD